MNLRETILAADDLKKEAVNVLEWNATLYVRTMKAREREQFEASCGNGKTLQDIRQKLIIFTVCDESGNLLFNIDDIEALSKKSGAALDRLFSASIALNKIRNEDIEELKKT